LVRRPPHITQQCHFVREVVRAAALSYCPRLVPAPSNRQGGGIAGIRTAQPVAAMTAHLQEGVNPPSSVVHHQDRVFAHVGGEELTRVWDLALVAQKQPAREDPLSFCV
jgi:hypothetical protein